MSISRLSIALGLVALTSAAVAATPVGHWTGKMSIKLPTLPPNTPANQRAMLEKMSAQFAAARIMLDVKANKTYTVTTSGMPGPQAKQTETGSWSQSGNVVTMTSPKNPNNKQNATLSADGKTMTIVIPGGRGKVVFTR